MVGDLYYLLMASLAYTSPCMGVINRLIGCYASGNLYFVYFFCLFFMCGGSVVFLNSLEMEGDEMNILVLKWANQDYFWSQVCEISWDPLIYYWGTWLLALISLQLLLSLLRFICFFLFDVCGVLVVQSFLVTPPMKSLETTKDATEEIGTQRKLKRKTQSCSQPTRKSFRILCSSTFNTWSRCKRGHWLVPSERRGKNWCNW